MEYVNFIIRPGTEKCCLLLLMMTGEERGETSELVSGDSTDWRHPLITGLTKTYQRYRERVMTDHPTCLSDG